MKEFILLRATFKTQLFSLLIFVAMSFIMKSIAYAGMMMAILISNMCLSSLSYDEASSWNRYAMTMPVRSDSLVSVKYVLLYLVIAFSALIILTIAVPFKFFLNVPFAESAMVGIVCVMLALFSGSLGLTACIKLGMEKARIIATLTYLVPFGLGAILYYFVVERQGIELSQVTETALYLVLALSLAVSVAVSFLCWKIGCGIMRKKEL